MVLTPMISKAKHGTNYCLSENNVSNENHTNVIGDILESPFFTLCNNDRREWPNSGGKVPKLQEIGQIKNFGVCGRMNINYVYRCYYTKVSKKLHDQNA